MSNSYIALNLMIFFLNFIGEATLMCRCVDGPKRRVEILLIRAFKLLGINMFFDIFLPFFYPGTHLHFMKVWVDAAAMIISVYLLKIILQFPWGKLGVVYLVADARAFVCTLLPLMMSAYVKSQSVIEYFKNVRIDDYIGCMIASLILLTVTEKLLRRQCNWLKENDLKNDWIWACLFFLYLICQMFLSVSATQSRQGKLSYPITWTMAIIVMAILFYFFMQQKQNQYLTMKADNLELQKRMILEYQKSVEEQIAITKKYRHDIANHMQTLMSLMEASEDNREPVIEYVEALQNQQKEMKELSYCDNVVINATIENKVKLCRQERIAIDVDCSGLKLGKVEEIDYLSILFNLLDNAIECCQKMNDLEYKTISLNSYSSRGQLILVVKNGCDCQLEVESFSYSSSQGYQTQKILENGFLETSKKDKALHGVGMTIITELVEKYQGDIDISFENSLFTVRINLPNV